MDSGPSAADLVFLFLALISVIYYIYTIVILLKNRSQPPFTTHFFRLFVSLGVADLCSALNEYLMLSAEWEWVDIGPLYLHPVLGQIGRRFNKGTYIFFGLSQYFGVLALAANRFYNVETTLWTARKQTIALVAQWLIPAVAVLPFVSQEFQVSFTNVSGKIVITTEPVGGKGKQYFMVISLIHLVVVIIVSVLYCRIFAHVRQIKNDFGITQDNHTELKLALVGLILLVLMLIQRSLFGSILVSTILFSKSVHLVHKHIIALIMHHMGIVFSLINPWLLFGCSQPTRQALFGCVYPSANNTVNVEPQPIQMKSMSTGPKPLKARPAVIKKHITTHS